MYPQEARPKNTLDQYRWEPGRSFKLTIFTQQGASPKQRYHTNFMENTPGIQVDDMTITVTDGLIQWRMIHNRYEMEAFQSSSGKTFWFDVYNQSVVTLFEFLE